MNIVEAIEEKLRYGIGAVLAGAKEEFVSDVPATPKQAEALMESLGWETGELQTNGWQYDWWLNFTKDGKSFTASGSGYYGGFKFYKSEVP